MYQLYPKIRCFQVYPPYQFLMIQTFQLTKMSPQLHQKTHTIHNCLNHLYHLGTTWWLIKEESISHALHSNSTLQWPATQQNPVNEFHSEGYFSCAFPILAIIYWKSWIFSTSFEFCHYRQLFQTSHVI